MTDARSRTGAYCPVIKPADARRCFRKVAAFVVWCSFAAGAFASGGSDDTAHQEQSSEDMPLNIVMILADDHCWRDFGFMGNEVVETPNLDALAAESAIYTHGYVPMSVCRPSLATIMTGLYPHQHGIHFNHPPPGLAAMRDMSAKRYRETRARAEVLIRRVPTLPKILGEQGYVSLQTGKHWEGSYETAGFTEGMTCGQPADQIGPTTGTREQNNGEWVAHGNGDAGLLIGRKTMAPIRQFLDRYAGESPFFIWYAPFLPHTPFNAPKRFQNVYETKDVPDHLLPYYAEIARFDETVGQLLQELDQRSLRERTLVVFASDNGFRPRRDRPERYNSRSKLSAYDDGLRTPILIACPHRVDARRWSEPVSTIDLVPTILTAIGLDAEITTSMRGRDLWQSATGSESLAEHPVFGAIYPNDAEMFGAPGRHVRARWIRDGDFKLIIPGPARPPIEPALYNVQQDPLEQRNLFADPSQEARIRRMKQRLDQWWDP